MQDSSTTSTQRPISSNSPKPGDSSSNRRRDVVDRSWIGNLATTVGLLAGAFLLAVNQQSPRDTLYVDSEVVRRLADAGRVEAPGPTVRQEPMTWPADAPPAAVAPLSAEQVQRLQRQWADYLGIEATLENSLGMSFVLIPPGEFLMGGAVEELDAGRHVVDETDQYFTSCYNSAAPQHRVRITYPFYLSRHELTQAEYQKVMGDNPSWHAATGSEQYYRELVRNLETAQLPVEGVTWRDAIEFCNRLSRMEQRKESYQETSSRGARDYLRARNEGYRLPTEAEWEMACRAGSQTRFPTGDREIDPANAGWHGTVHKGRPHRVGELDCNPLGLFDMGHNVWEWVEDSFDPTYYQSVAAITDVDPLGSPDRSTLRVVRGGMWPRAATSAFDRYGYPHDFQCNFLGFRIVLPVSNAKLPSSTSRQH